MYSLLHYCKETVFQNSASHLGCPLCVLSKLTTLFPSPTEVTTTLILTVLTSLYFLVYPPSLYLYTSF